MSELKKSEKFIKIKQIGQGGYGKILLIKDSITSELFALKKMKVDVI